MGRGHAGQWASKRDADQIIANGKALQGPFNTLSRKEFIKYVEQTYQVGDRTALDWMNVAKRFADRPHLIRGFPQTIICSLAAPALNDTDVLDILSKIQSGKMKGDTRTVKDAVSDYIKHRRSQEQQKIPIDRLCDSPPLEEALKNGLSNIVKMRHYTKLITLHEEITVKATVKKHHREDKLSQVQMLSPKIQVWLEQWFNKFKIFLRLTQHHP